MVSLFLLPWWRLLLWCWGSSGRSCCSSPSEREPAGPLMRLSAGHTKKWFLECAKIFLIMYLLRKKEACGVYRSPLVHDNIHIEPHGTCTWRQDTGIGLFLTTVTSLNISLLNSPTSPLCQTWIQKQFAAEQNYTTIVSSPAARQLTAVVTP